MLESAATEMLGFDWLLVAFMGSSAVCSHERDQVVAIFCRALVVGSGMRAEGMGRTAARVPSTSLSGRPLRYCGRSGRAAA